MATLFSRPILQSIHTDSASDQGKPCELNGVRLAGFASLAVPIYAAQMPLTVYLPAIYAQQFGLSLAMIGTIFLAERLWGRWPIR